MCHIWFPSITHVIRLIVYVMHRFSVWLVYGTGLNTRRSPSLMRLVSTGWQLPGTAETPEMRWEATAYLVITRTARRSLHKTGTTTTLMVLMAIILTVQSSIPAAGGTMDVRDRDSSNKRLHTGQPFPPAFHQKMSRPVTRWSKSTEFIRKCIDDILFDWHTSDINELSNCKTRGSGTLWWEWKRAPIMKWTIVFDLIRLFSCGLLSCIIDDFLHGERQCCLYNPTTAVYELWHSLHFGVCIQIIYCCTLW